MLLRENFPDVPQLELPGYAVTYSRSGGTFVVKILSQVPRILRAIRNERNWLRRMQAAHRFDLVISDNRYGLKIEGLPAVIMTHQLQILTGFGPAADYVMRKLHYRMLGKFDACWVVDEQANGGLGGKLSHPADIPEGARYVGLLSQLNDPAPEMPVQSKEVLVLLSGPEPMRTLFEKRLMEQMAGLTDYQFRLVAGNPGGAMPARLPAHVRYATHVNASGLSEAMGAAGLVICRSGYSTLMDLAALGKKALLVPTPGQSEQMYLAAHLQRKGIALSRSQALLNLANDIPEAMKFPGFPVPMPAGSQDSLRQVLESTLAQL